MKKKTTNYNISDIPIILRVDFWLDLTMNEPPLSIQFIYANFIALYSKVRIVFDIVFSVFCWTAICFCFSFQLDYKVDANKLRQVFKLAGRVIDVDLSLDKDGKSRGFAVVEFDHPVEAVQAISMFDQQMLYERRMKIRLDRVQENEKMIEGLGGIGLGLGPNGEPLRNVAHNLPSLQNQNCVNNNLSMANAPNPVSAPLGAGSILGPVPNSSLTSNLAALNNVVGNLGNLGNLNNLNQLLTPLGLGNLANAANTSDSLGSNYDLASKNFLSSGSNAGGMGSSGNYNNLSQSNRHDSNISSQYSSGMGNSSASGNTGYAQNQRASLGDYDLSNTRGYNTQNEDYNRPTMNYSTSAQLQNIIKNGTNVGSNASGRNMSDTILIRNVSLASDKSQ